MRNHPICQPALLCVFIVCPDTALIAKDADTRAVSIEVGIQNSGLGLVLVFNFFEGLGGMAIITAWWGIWHIIAGLIAAFIFSRQPLASREKLKLVKPSTGEIEDN